MKTKRRYGLFPSKVHPIWNGIGCLMLALLPALAWGLSDILLDYLFVQYPNLALEFSAANPGGVSLFYLKIGAAVILTVVLYLFFAILVSLIYSLMGGSRNAEIAERIGSGRRR